MKSLLLAVCLVLALRCGEAAVSCSTTVAELYPCVSYIVQGGTVPESCCNGIKALNSQAQTSADRQSVCRCIKSAIGGVSYTSNNLNNALSLPSKCGLNLPYRFSPSTNCDSIN
ncbi:PREDICTED: non-specific lipid-transfer protein 6-like [Camelina sativa]|uniref:Non-specific lipid-transfer protein n=1 Tax=Camelina sativa TaxID=90675 RepID=A0ABM0W216_CAMSA|nr:PREDICTED: non-specific lipid-transfer protein 6-like [Camelina sativa]